MRPHTSLDPRAPRTGADMVAWTTRNLNPVYASLDSTSYPQHVVSSRRWIGVGLLLTATASLVFFACRSNVLPSLIRRAPVAVTKVKASYQVRTTTASTIAAAATSTVPWRNEFPAAPSVMFDMSFPGHQSVCNDTVPTLGELQAASGGRDTVEIRHVVCCSGIISRHRDSSDSAPLDTHCRSAPKRLSVPLRHAEAALKSGQRAVDLDELDLPGSLVFVTGASTDHFTESLLLIRSLQKFQPKLRMLYWDLGLTPDEAAKIKKLCGVEYRLFNASKYPPHVSTLKTYAFKPLIIMESFAESPVLWWTDASIRFTSARVDHVLALMKQRHGIVMYRDPWHSVWSTTYPQTYEYMATDVEGLKDTVTATGASFLIANTRELFSTVLFWLYACVLDQRCIAPVMFPEPCDMRGRDYFAKCHRFDQSVLTIVVANIWGFNSDGYRYQQDMFRVHRGEDGGNVGDKDVAECTLG